MTDADRKRFFSKTKLATEIRPGMETPCLEWQAGRTRKGYGQLRIADKMVSAHRLAWEIAHGSIPSDLCVLHKCDNPRCVAPDHLFLGTLADNNADRDAKGRQVAPRGDANGSRLHPERLARGDRNGARLHRDRMPRGNANGARLHPERLARGERQGQAKLTDGKIRFIFALRAQGWTQTRIADVVGVAQTQISNILARKTWAHVQLEGFGGH